MPAADPHVAGTVRERGAATFPWGSSGHLTSNSAQLGSLPRCRPPDWPLVTTGVICGSGSQQFSDSYTPVTPLTHEVKLGSFTPFSPACLPWFLVGGPGSSCSPSGHLCVVIMYRGPGWPRVGVFTPSSVPWFSLPSVLALYSLFKGTCTGTGNVSHLPPPPSFLSFLFTHLPLYSQASPALSDQGPCLSLCPSQPSSPFLGKGSSPEL